MKNQSIGPLHQERMLYHGTIFHSDFLGSGGGVYVCVHFCRG